MHERKEHPSHPSPAVTAPGNERIMLAGLGQPIFNLGFVGGVIALTVAGGTAVLSTGGFGRFYHAYLANFAFYLTVVLGGLFFVIINHLARAGWSVAVRRPAENLATCMPVMAAAFAPLAVSVLSGDGALYPWAQPLEAHEAGHAPAETPPGDVAHVRPLSEGGDIHLATHTDAGTVTGHDDADAQASASTVMPRGGIDPHTEAELVAKKRAYLNAPFFIIRCVGYFAIWSLLGWWYWKQSRRQDTTGDDALTLGMQRLSPVAAIALALTVTFAAFDLLMSLSPAWYSTIFGVYLLAGIMVTGMATLILVLMGLQRAGILTASVTTEHYHDLGKYLFAFVFFWGYIAFSQYLLIWYANLPETTFWFAIRGASTSAALTNDWSYVAVALLVGNFLIPFAGLLSRHVKRSRFGLAFWAVWLLVFHWIDLWWLVMPQMGPQVRFGLPEVATFLGLGGLLVAFWVRVSNRLPLLAIGDPRLRESLAFENV